MTMSPHTRISELQGEGIAQRPRKTSSLTLGSLFAAGFITVISFIANRFYR